MRPQARLARCRESVAACLPGLTLAKSTAPLSTSTTRSFASPARRDLRHSIPHARCRSRLAVAGKVSARARHIAPIPPHPTHPPAIRTRAAAAALETKYKRAPPASSTQLAALPADPARVRIRTRIAMNLAATFIPALARNASVLLADLGLTSPSTTTTPNAAPARNPAAAATSAAPRDEDGVDDEYGDLKCQWAGCCARFADAELLFHHLSEDHVGRKAAGTLCLECKWTLPGGHICGLAKTKRDHLTSHLRVHMTDLKPHWCPDCKKRFKRPQDLKKHELTFSHIATRTKNSRRRSAQLAPTTPNEAASSSSAPASRSLAATSTLVLPSPPPPPPRRGSSSGSFEGSLLAPPNAHRLQLPTPALSGRDGPSPSPVGLPPVNYTRMPSPIVDV
ncbi:hypothetical protein AMAG_18371 [Allomyces macrogynus ATCC 38327]|uniref:C2H2-type domain-containing protein n=1 Tax=Allomyces macrogynus (strain ATCC 38327) TaxID=578462 RepID=A0A0L0S672_ALLM3|nr:hypothetical protein AMAG_18371 [Allomyces macrogynus ATCC 38327]|eukprot:KNE58078.1 hypothetical protein AMAG_18371 [Allomyces macrogynus ATCC 38327]